MVLFLQYIRLTLPLLVLFWFSGFSYLSFIESIVLILYIVRAEEIMESRARVSGQKRIIVSRWLRITETGRVVSCKNLKNCTYLILFVNYSFLGKNPKRVVFRLFPNSIPVKNEEQCFFPHKSLFMSYLVPILKGNGNLLSLWLIKI